MPMLVDRQFLLSFLHLSIEYKDKGMSLEIQIQLFNWFFSIVCNLFVVDFNQILLLISHVDDYPTMRMGRWLVECLLCSHKVCQIKPSGSLVVQVQHTCCFESFGLVMIFHANLLLAQASS